MEDMGAFWVGQAVGAVGEVCGVSWCGVSWGDTARSSGGWTTRLRSFLYSFYFKLGRVEEKDKISQLDQGKNHRWEDCSGSFCHPTPAFPHLERRRASLPGWRA